MPPRVVLIILFVRLNVLATTIGPMPSAVVAGMGVEPITSTKHI